MLRPYIDSRNRNDVHRKVASRYLIAEAGSLLPEELTADIAVTAWNAIEAHGYSQSTRRGVAFALRQLLRRLHDDGAPPRLAEVVPHVHTPAPRSVTVTADDLEKVLRLAPPSLRLLIMLCHDCALRSGTAAIVTHRHITEENELIVSTKFGNVVRIPLSARLRSLIAAVTPPMLKDSDVTLLAMAQGRTHFGSQSLRQLWAAHVKSCGLPKGTRLHDLRRTMAESVYKATKDLRVTQSILGHHSLYSTLHYIDRPHLATAPQLAAAIRKVVPK